MIKTVRACEYSSFGLKIGINYPSSEELILNLELIKHGGVF